MNTMQQTVYHQVVSAVTYLEKAQQSDCIVRGRGNAFPGIETSPGICGGEPCIAHTRIPVWILVQFKKFGASESDLLVSYPTFKRQGFSQCMGLLPFT